jgi:hypothetical protein
VLEIQLETSDQGAAGCLRFGNGKMPLMFLQDVLVVAVERNGFDW